MARSAPYSRAATGRWRSLPPIDVEHIIARRPERGRPDLADEHGGPRLLGGQVSYEMPAAAARGAGSRWWVYLGQLFSSVLSASSSCDPRSRQPELSGPRQENVSSKTPVRLASCKKRRILRRPSSYDGNRSSRCRLPIAVAKSSDNDAGNWHSSRRNRQNGALRLVGQLLFPSKETFCITRLRCLRQHQQKKIARGYPIFDLIVPATS
jgi:hypothetical protein